MQSVAVPVYICKELLSQYILSRRIKAVGASFGMAAAMVKVMVVMVVIIMKMVMVVMVVIVMIMIKMVVVMISELARVMMRTKRYEAPGQAQQNS